MASLVPGPEMQDIKSFEILHFLKQGPAEVSMIARIGFKDANPKNREFLARFEEAQLLEQEEGGDRVYYLKKKPIRENFLETGGFIMPPFAIHGDNVRVAFVGSDLQVDQFLATIESTNISYKVISLTDAKFSFDSPLNALTEKQRTALIAAFSSGYYDVPRQINSEQLAKKLHIRHSALNIHLRKAEHHLLSQLLAM